MLLLLVVQEICCDYPRSGDGLDIILDTARTKEALDRILFLVAAVFFVHLLLVCSDSERSTTTATTTRSHNPTQPYSYRKPHRNHMEFHSPQKLFPDIPLDPLTPLEWDEDLEFEAPKFCDFFQLQLDLFTSNGADETDEYPMALRSGREVLTKSMSHISRISTYLTFSHVPHTYLTCLNISAYPTNLTYPTFLTYRERRQNERWFSRRHPEHEHDCSFHPTNLLLEAEQQLHLEQQDHHPHHHHHHHHHGEDDGDHDDHHLAQYVAGFMDELDSAGGCDGGGGGGGGGDSISGSHSAVAAVRYIGWAVDRSLN